VQGGVIGGRCRQHGLEGHGGGHFGVADQFFTPVDGQASNRGHKCRAIDQGIAFLGNQLEAWDTGLAHGLVATHLFPGIPGLAAVPSAIGITGCHNGDGGQGNQVATGSQGTFFWDIRGDTPVEHFDQGFHDHRSDSGWPTGHGVGPDDHHGPDDLFGQWFADTGHIGKDDISGKLIGLGRIDGFIGVGAEPGIDAVEHGILFLNGMVQPLLGGGHARFCLLTEWFHGRPVLGHRVDFLDGQHFSGDLYCCHDTFLLTTILPFLMTIQTALLPSL